MLTNKIGSKVQLVGDYLSIITYRRKTWKVFVFPSMGRFQR